MLQRGHSGDGCDLASTLCKYDLRRGSMSSELLICGEGLRSILLLSLVVWRSLLKIVFFSLDVLKCVVCLCRGCDGCCVFCLFCEAWSCRCSCMGSVSVSSIRC